MTLDILKLKSNLLYVNFVYVMSDHNIEYIKVHS